MNDSRACFSADRQYRYLLRRRVNDSANRHVLFVMLNPSTADEVHDDPTIRRCINFARAWGYGRLSVVNLFAYRATNPASLKRADDPVGPRNDSVIHKVAQQADTVIMAWGNNGSLLDRSRIVRKLLRQHCEPFHLGLTQQGEPRHPLYLKRAQTPIPDRQPHPIYPVYPVNPC